MIKQLLTSVLDVIYPPTCMICQRALYEKEQYICLSCLNELPLTRLSYSEVNEADKIFWGLVEVEKVMSFIYYEKGSNFNHLLHNLKYKGYYQLGTTLGQLMAQGIDPCFFKTIDFIIPVPIHPKKEKLRGYNQSLWLSKGIQRVYSIPIDCDTLQKGVFTESQTRKGVYERRTNTEDVFQLNPNKRMEGKHILLVDDVLTTGATLTACCSLLKSEMNVKVSILTFALTRE